jgi:F0F1-type ATP synthase assembly protein I
MLLLLINIVTVIVVGAILFYLIDKFVRDGRLANLLKILVALICLAAILQRLLPMIGVSGL